MSKQIYIVYSIDTEGPLNEPLDATFDRIKEMFDLDITPTNENLKKLQNKQIVLNGREAEVAMALSPHLLNYNNTWEKLDRI